MTAVDYKEDQPLITSNRSNFNYRHGTLVFSSVLCIHCYDTKHTFVAFGVFLGGVHVIQKRPKIKITPFLGGVRLLKKVPSLSDE